MIMGQIGEYRELSSQERLDNRMRDLRSALEKKETDSIAGMFAELLGCLEDAACWLHKVNAQYPDDDDDASDNPFWGETYEATDPLNRIIKGLRAIEKCVPKETEPVKEQVP